MIVATNMCVSHDNFVVVVFVVFVATKSLLCQLSPMIVFICRCWQSLARLVTPGEEMQFHWAMKHARAASHYFSYSITKII